MTAWIVLSLLMLAAAGALGVLLWARSNSGQRKLLAAAVRSAQGSLQGKLSIGRLEGDLTHDLVLRDVRVLDTEGQLAVRVDKLTAHYDLLGLLRKNLHFSDVTIEGGYLHARVMKNGKLNLSELARQEEKQAEATGQPLEVVVKQLTGDVALEYDGRDRDQRARAQLHLDGSVTLVGPKLDVELATLTLATRAPLEAMIDAHGGLHADNGAYSLKDLRINLHTDGHQLNHVAPEAKLRGPVVAELRADGTLAGMTLSLAVRPASGELRVDGQANLALPGKIEWQGTVRAAGIDPGQVRVGAPHGRIELAAHGKGENASGTIVLERLIADAAGTHARAQGTITLGEGPPAIDVTASVKSPDLSRLASLGVPGLAGSLDAHGHVIRRAGHLDIDADVTAQKLAVAATRVARLDAHVHTVDLRGAATVHARAVDLPNGELRLNTVNLDAAGDRQHLTLDLDASGPRGAIAKVRAHGVPLPSDGSFATDLTLDQLLLGAHWQRWQSTAPGRLRIDDQQILTTLALADATAQKIGIDARMDRRSKALDLKVNGHALDVQKLVRLIGPDADTPALRNLPKIELALDAHLEHQRVKGTVDVKSSGPSVNARIDAPVSLVEGNQPLSVDLTATDVELQRLKAFLPPGLQPLEGRVRVTASARGTTRKPELTAQIDAPDWSLAELEHNRTSLDLSYRDAQLDARVTAELKRKSALAGSLAVLVHAPIDLPAAMRSKRYLERLEHTVPITVSAQAQHLDLQRLPLGRLGVSTPLTAGKVDANLQLHGTLHEPVADVRIEGHGLATAQIDQVDVDLRAGYEKRRAHGELNARLHGAAILTAKAETSVDVQKIVDHQAWRDAPLTVDVTVPSYDLSRLQKFSGMIAGDATVRGTLAHPTGKAQLRGRSLKLADMRFSTFDARASFDGNVVDAKLDAAELPSGAVHGSARVPIAADAPIAITLKADHLMLALAHLGALRKLDGTLDADLKVGGTRAAPVVDGRLHIDKGALAISEDPRLYQDLIVDLTAHNSAVELKKLFVRVGSGSLSAHGTVTLAGLKPTKMDLYAEANKFPFQSGNVGAWVDASAELHGHQQGNQMTGDLTITKGTAHLPKLAGTRQLQSTGPLADVVFTDETALQAERAREKAKSDQTPISADVLAHIPGPFHVRSPELATDLQGQLEVKLVAGVPKLFGHAETTWGHIELLGRRYEIDHARVGFSGDVDPDPTLDVRVTREITDTTIVIEVHGTAKKPQLVLAADPPIYDSSQIIGIIISGDPGDQRIDTRSTNQKVVGAISGLLVNKIKEQVAPGLPIDVIKVDTGTGSDSFGGTSNTRLEVGKYITETVYVSYVHQFGSQSGLHPTNSNEANLEYRFKRHYQLATRFGDAGAGSLDFYWSLRY